MNSNQQDIKAGFNVPLSDTGWVARFAGANLTRDGFGENVRTGQDVSDKEIVAGRFTLGYVGSDAWSFKFTADHIDDASAVRGARMLGVNRFAPTIRSIAFAAARWCDTGQMPHRRCTMTGTSQ